MNTFSLIIASPDGDLFRGEVAALFLRGAEGDLAVLAGHTPFVTTVQPCVCRIELPDGTVRTADAPGGLLSVSAEATRLLSGGFRFRE